MANKPFDKKRCGRAHVTVWENVIKGKDGETFKSYSYTIDKNYKDKEGNYKTTNIFQEREVPGLIFALEKAYMDRKVVDREKISD